VRGCGSTSKSKIPEGRSTSCFEELDIPFGGLKASYAGAYL